MDGKCSSAPWLKSQFSIRCSIDHDDGFYVFILLSRESDGGAKQRTNPDSLRSCPCFRVFRLNFASDCTIYYSICISLLILKLLQIRYLNCNGTCSLKAISESKDCICIFLSRIVKVFFVNSIRLQKLTELFSQFTFYCCGTNSNQTFLRKQVN